MVGFEPHAHGTDALTFGQVNVYDHNQLDKHVPERVHCPVTDATIFCHCVAEDHVPVQVLLPFGEGTEADQPAHVAQAPLLQL